MSLPLATRRETFQVLGTVVAPLLARGVIVRRPRAVRVAERMGADTRAVHLLQELRRRHGRGPLRLRIPGRRMVVLLDPAHVHRVLQETPEPFSAATLEKRAALGHFQPENVLVSSPADRPHRRPFQEVALDHARPVHRGSAEMIGRVHEEVDALLDRTDVTGLLDWDTYARSWWRIVRRLSLGEGAADDEALTDDMRRLRAAANWAFLTPRRPRLRASVLGRIQEHLDRAEPGTLAHWAAQAPTDDRTEPAQQVAHWLFAWDAGAWSSVRALALLATHPDVLARARAEADAVDLRTPQLLPYLRSVQLESVRLWPTTPAILRESLARTRWEGGPMPERTSILTYAPFFHRDDEHLASANRLDPGLWAGERTAADWPLVPFSEGPAGCPARNVVLHTVSTVLARIVAERDVELLDARLSQDRDLPGTLDPFTLRFAVRPRG